MEDGCGIYRTGRDMQATCDKIAELKQRYKRLQLDDHSRAWNTEWLLAIELGYLLDVAQAMAHSALQPQGVARLAPAPRRLRAARRRELSSSTRSPTMPATARRASTTAPVKITKSQPGTRAYGAAGEKADAERKNEASHA